VHEVRYLWVDDGVFVRVVTCWNDRAPRETGAFFLYIGSDRCSALSPLPRGGRGWGAVQNNLQRRWRSRASSAPRPVCNRKHG